MRKTIYALAISSVIYLGQSVQTTARSLIQAQLRVFESESGSLGINNQMIIPSRQREQLLDDDESPGGNSIIPIEEESKDIQEQSERIELLEDDDSQRQNIIIPEEDEQQEEQVQEEERVEVDLDGVAIKMLAQVGLTTFEKDALASHNAKRLLHKNTSPFTWSTSLAANAQAYAQKLAASSTFAHQTNNPNGENLFIAMSTGTVTASAAQATSIWYAEISKYKYTSPAFSSATGHFTQVVWTSTTQVGVGYAYGKYKGYNAVWIVGEYYPPGNYNNQYATKVQPLK